MSGVTFKIIPISFQSIVLFVCGYADVSYEVVSVMSACVSDTLTVASLLCVVTILGAERIFTFWFCCATPNTLVKPYSSIEKVKGDASTPCIGVIDVLPVQPRLPSLDSCE